ncbi:hypothetical protein EON66_00405 [archaeon]|nr:MAG: hypothetical protein EON66_00405 [archaeon]
MPSWCALLILTARVHNVGAPSCTQLQIERLKREAGQLQERLEAVEADFAAKFESVGGAPAYLRSLREQQATQQSRVHELTEQASQVRPLSARLCVHACVVVSARPTCTCEQRVCACTCALLGVNGAGERCVSGAPQGAGRH